MTDYGADVVLESLRKERDEAIELLKRLLATVENVGSFSVRNTPAADDARRFLQERHDGDRSAEK